MPRVIVNATPIIVLAKAGCLSLLKELFGVVTVPQAVFDEVTKKSDRACAGIKDSAWIRVEKMANAVDRGMYRAGLHAGEREVIALAQRTEDPLIIMDDHAARETAASLGLPVMGTLGVLLDAKAKGVLPAVKPVLDRIVANGLYMDETLYELVLGRAGESRHA